MYESYGAPADAGASEVDAVAASAGSSSFFFLDVSLWISFDAISQHKSLRSNRNMNLRLKDLNRAVVV